MGGCEYYKLIKQDGGQVPKTDAKLLKNCMKGILDSVEKGSICSCHDISEGGIAVCLSEMCIGGNIGADVDISKLGNSLRSDFILFSESNTRWIVEVEPKKQKKFEEIVNKHKTPFVLIGKTKAKKLTIKDKEKLVDQNIKNLRDCWKSPISDIVG
jgi:phosphoribosylformylglycinamidine synthase